MKILLAVSGGIDSMYMAERALEGTLFADYAPNSFTVAHCNFRLRASESDTDEAFVADWCANHGIPLLRTSFDTAAYAAGHGISIEMAARELRYSWFADICRKGGFDAVAVAHNANDNAETLILNLLRGTGLKGIRGMQATSPLRQGMPEDPPHPVLLRPLLKTRRADIARWMAENGKSWREDSSNASTEYKRNRIRCNVFPEFEKMNPSFLDTLNSDMERFAQADGIVDDWFASVSPALVDGHGGIRLKELLALRHWKYALWRLTGSYGFSEETFGKLTALLERYSSAPIGTVTLSGKTFQTPTHTVSIRRTTLTAKRK